MDAAGADEVCGGGDENIGLRIRGEPPGRVGNSVVLKISRKKSSSSSSFSVSKYRSFLLPLVSSIVVTGDGQPDKLEVCVDIVFVSTNPFRNRLEYVFIRRLGSMPF